MAQQVAGHRNGRNPKACGVDPCQYRGRAPSSRGSHDVPSSLDRCDGVLLNTRRASTNGHTGRPNQPMAARATPGTTKASWAGEPPGKSRPAAAMTRPTGKHTPRSSPKRVTDRSKVPLRWPVELTAITHAYTTR